MSSSNEDVNVLRSHGAIPSNPFEVEVTKNALQRRLDAGDITRADIDILKKSYNWIAIATTLGTAAGIPVWFALGRRKPPMPFGLRFMSSLAMSMSGSFLGFTMGGAAAAMEVNRHMPDAPRKLAVFQEIALDARRAIAEHRQGIPDGTIVSHVAGVPANDRMWTPPGAGDAGVASETERMLSERTRERSLLDPAAQRGTDVDRPPLPSPRQPGVPGQQGASTWDKLRGKPVAAGVAGEKSVEDEYARRQREFDEMLERERRGQDDTDKWK